MNIETKNQININDSRIAVLGLGKSGEGAAHLANYLGANVIVSDNNINPQIKNKSKNLELMGIEVELGEHTKNILNADLWIISPGISQEKQIFHEAKSNGIPIISEVEFASWYTSDPIISVTGSNGKTTTVHLIYQMCDFKPMNPILVGNIGTSFSSAILNDLKNKQKNRLYILEVSSFQMEAIMHFKPFISLLLNITPDHLDRYPSMAEYTQAKLNMIKNQTDKDHIVYNIDDKILSRRIDPNQSNSQGFSISESNQTIFYIKNSNICKNNSELICTEELKLPGRHNLANSLAAATVASLMGVNDTQISKVLKTFTGVEHRLEFVSSVSGVSYYNDSKATNLESVKVAINSFENKIYLILGGKDKGGDFVELIPFLKEKVKNVITFGQASKKISLALRDAVRLKQVKNLKDAVEFCHLEATPGDTVLLSPGCASFDQFKNYEERGQVFKEFVKDIANA
tara:strand:+ start:6917 stop:8293 length:1377 start_codon:yes stop_codon:yes gene_type:complete